MAKTRYIVKIASTATRRWTAVFVTAKSPAEAERVALDEAPSYYDRAQAKVA